MKIGSKRLKTPYILALSMWLVIIGNTPVNAGKKPISSCQKQNIETLTNRLIKDLPSYTNRVTQRSRRLKRVVDIYSYVLLAGKPEFAPLSLGPGAYTPTAPTTGEPQQVFITTLERQYTAGKLVQLQQYHWLFFTQTNSGWQLAFMFSRTGNYPNNQPPTPPRESSNGAVAQAVRLWLRDCQAGTLRSR